MDSAKEKEEEIKEKKKVNPVRKVYTSGVGKFIHPNMKKEARYSSLNFFYEILIYPIIPIILQMTELNIFVLISGKQKGQMTSAFHQRRRKHPRSMTSARGRIKE